MMMTNQTAVANIDNGTNKGQKVSSAVNQLDRQALD